MPQPKLVSVRQHPESDVAVSVSEALAKSAGLKVLDQPAVDRYGRPLGPRPIEQATPKPTGSASGGKGKSGAKSRAKKTAGKKAAKSSARRAAGTSSGGAATAPTPEEASK